MASAVLASRNEPCWGERKVYMRKIPIFNSNPRPIPKDPIPSLNPSAADCAGDRTKDFYPMEVDEAPPAAAAVLVSDDSSKSSSLKRKFASLNKRRDPSGGCSGDYVTFNITTYSKKELRELKQQLISELELVRSLVKRIESMELQPVPKTAEYGPSEALGADPVNSSAPSQLFRPVKEKVSGNKTSLPLMSPREPKRSAVATGSEKLLSAMMKKCGQILSKLMKNRKSGWFNSPVDVVGMGLHDYYQIIKNPMDLGTVKSKLDKGLYPSPVEFAADIRMTFNNALRYNPQGHEVHKLADQFLSLFESLFVPACEKYEKQRSVAEREEGEKHKMSSWSCTSMPETAMRSEVAHLPRVQQPAPNPPRVSATAEVQKPLPPSGPIKQQQQRLQPHPRLLSPVQQQQRQYPMASAMSGKQPKPKAKDPNKRPMNHDEKQKLGLALEKLPHERMVQVLQIMKKRNADPLQNGDEIELDIEAIDTETLWELDRFVFNCKKMMSKIRRQEEARANGLISGGQLIPGPAPLPAEDGDKSPVPIDTPEAAAASKSRKVDPGEEDVDIGDEMPSTQYPSVEIKKDTGDATSSSSSDSDSTSSSDSDSESSSGSDSDDDGAESPGVGLRSSSRN